jgi:hypothetical protein
MLVITIDLVPGGHESYRHTIGSVRIANLSKLADTSDYSVEVMEAANHLTGAPQRGLYCTCTRPQAERLCVAGQSLRGDHEGRFRRIVEIG